MNTTNYLTLDDFLKKHRASSQDELTHVRIGDPDQNIYGGRYSIPETEINEFNKLYYRKVFLNKEKEYLVEIQRKDGNGQIVIDIDMRYDTEVKSRQHTDDHIDDLIITYMDKIASWYEIEDNAEVNVYVLQKDKVNITSKETKDGIHIVIGMRMDHIAQQMLRDEIMKEFVHMFSDIPLTNSVDKIFDEGISKGTTGWQMYGSRKPNYDVYKLYSHYVFNYDEEDEMFNHTKVDLNRMPMNELEYLTKMSQRYPKGRLFKMNEEGSKKLEKYLQKVSGSSSSGKGNGNGSTNNTRVFIPDGLSYDFRTIKSVEELHQLCDIMFKDIPQDKYHYHETFRYLMCLPPDFYNDYDKWIRCGWALHNTHPNIMFIPWMAFSSQSPKFDIRDMEAYYEIWEKMKDEGLSNRSIIYWAKEHNPIEYKAIHTDTVEYYMEISTIPKRVTETDMAIVLYHMYKDEFRCGDVKHNVWYQFKKNRWVKIDSGTELRKNISSTISKMYGDKSVQLSQVCTDLNDEEKANDKEKWEKMGEVCSRYSEISIDLKRTVVKNNIMKEAADQFIDPEFLNRLDTNKNLLAFTNGVIDFEKKEFRKGMPDDYISLSTNIAYIPYNSNNPEHERIRLEIEDFFEKIFPKPEVRRYMWEHLASCLIGGNKPQTFNIYNGNGSNGKSKLVELMRMILGDLFAEVPATMVTGPRQKVGQLSPEIAALKGKRFAMMSEPSKGDVLNDGVMKQLTGEDIITARGLYKDSMSFIPQFKLVVCTNNLFDIKSNDDGTWRRIRKCDFISKFEHNPKPDEENPYKYPIDVNLSKKFEQWKHIFMALLVNLAFETNGNVKDCKEVTEASNQYRKREDYLMDFFTQRLEKNEQGKIKKTEVFAEFKKWFQDNYGKNVPKGREFYEFLEKKVGKFKNDVVRGWIIKYDTEDEFEPNGLMLDMPDDC